MKSEDSNAPIAWMAARSGSLAVKNEVISFSYSPKPCLHKWIILIPGVLIFHVQESKQSNKTSEQQIEVLLRYKGSILGAA